MVTIELNKYANQNVNVTIDNDYFSLTFKSFKGITLATIHKNGESLIESILCHPNKNILPYKHMAIGGNFRFDCINDEYPYFTRFGDDCVLHWYSDAELEAMEA